MTSEKSQEEVQKLHQQLIEWVKTDPHLPNDFGKQLYSQRHVSLNIFIVFLLQSC